MNWITILGLCASFLSVSGFVPQVIKSWKTNDTSSLSLKTFVLFCVASMVWLIYGLLKKDVAIVVANTILLILQLSLVYLKLKR